MTTKTTRETLTDLGGDDALDLLSLDTGKAMSEAIPVNILNPFTKKPTGAVIWILGKDSDTVTRYINDEVNSRIRREAALRERGKSPEPPTVEKGQAQTIELLIVATTRWENVRIGEDRNVDFSVARAKELYKVAFVREQLAEAMGDLENFIKG
jgi:hypothetical protein